MHITRHMRPAAFGGRVEYDVELQELELATVL